VCGGNSRLHTRPTNGSPLRLEIELLFHINFRLFVSPDDYNRYESELRNHTNARVVRAPKLAPPAQEPEAFNTTPKGKSKSTGPKSCTSGKKRHTYRQLTYDECPPGSGQRPERVLSPEVEYNSQQVLSG